MSDTTTAMPHPDTCGYCGKIHTGVCGLIKAIEYHPDGTTKRVEFHPPRQIEWGPGVGQTSRGESRPFGWPWITS
jgi:hypothetical protein